MVRPKPQTPNLVRRPLQGLICGVFLATASLALGYVSWRPEVAGEIAGHVQALKGVATGKWAIRAYIRALVNADLVCRLINNFTV